LGERRKISLIVSDVICILFYLFIILRSGGSAGAVQKTY
jgi:hypothetical protein